jgi:hypothetical protein
MAMDVARDRTVVVEGEMERATVVMKRNMERTVVMEE